MNWQLIFLLSGFGILMGILSANGLTRKIEPFLWLAFSFISAFIISKNVSRNLFLYGLIVGILWGVFNSVLQSIFFNTYLKNNPRYKEAYAKNAVVKPRYFILLVGPMIGLVTGIVLGGLAWLCYKIL